MNIRKAIITTAGFGTRFLPISKTIQKEMLPILERPLVDYVVADCVRAGIEEIIFVINEHNDQILHFYRENRRLYEYLKRMNKLQMYEPVAHLHTQAKFTFVRQLDNDPYGTATPVKLARQAVESEEAFLVLMGDDFIYNGPTHSVVADMISAFKATKAAGLVTCLEKPWDVLHKYGVIETEQTTQGLVVKNIVEKPAPGTAPSNLTNISKYILTPAIFDIIDAQDPHPSSNELLITDSVLTLARQHPVIPYIPQGEYLDGGYVAGWLKANLTVLAENKTALAEVKEFLATSPIFKT